MNGERDISIGSRSSARRRPPVTVTFEVPGTPDRPRLASYLAAARRISRFVLVTLAAIWILGGMLFFFIRFSTLFYLDNRHAIQNLLERLFH